MNEKTVIMPKLKPDMENGTVCAFCVKIGDTVKIGDVLFEVETDKVVTQIESTFDGTVTRIFADEGDVVNTNAPVIELS